jgi:hypothetical protein
MPGPLRACVIFFSPPLPATTAVGAVPCVLHYHIDHKRCFLTKDHHNRCWVELQTEGAQASARHGLCFPGFQDRLRARLNPKTRARRSLPCPKRFINTITLRSLPPHHHQLGSIRVGDFTGILKWILYPDVQRFSLHKAWLFCNSDRH